MKDEKRLSESVNAQLAQPISSLIPHPSSLLSVSFGFAAFLLGILFAARQL